MTPNLPEAAALLGGREITDIDAMRAAAQDLHALGPQNVLVKGGHLATGIFCPSKPRPPSLLALKALACVVQSLLLCHSQMLCMHSATTASQASAWQLRRMVAPRILHGWMRL